MTKITPDDVQRIARLAHIAITNEEAQKFTGELGTIIGYFQKLQQVDTTGLEPTYQITGLANVQRPDNIVDYGVTQQDLLHNAPRQENGQIKVPRVL